MNTKSRHRGSVILVFLVLVTALAAAIWHYGYRQALDQLARRGEADLELASDRLSTQLQVYQELAVLMARHPVMVGLADSKALGAARALLLEVADTTAAFDVMYVDRTGRVLASARGLLGPNLSDASYFRRAMQGALGRDHGFLQPGGVRAYTYGAPAFGADGKVQGALIVVAGIEDIESDWRGSNPVVLFTDQDGIVFISNRSELLYPNQPGWDRITSRKVGRHQVLDIDLGPYLPRRALHLTRDLAVLDLVGEVLVDVAPARRLAMLQVATVLAICLAFGAILNLVAERRRVLAEANAVLESRVVARTRDLSDANAALQQAQADLVQAGKLSALGQMSAGISHELNQPLMAIRSYAENGAKFLERGQRDMAAGNIAKISELARRMGRIIKNLRAFARNEAEPMGKVDLVQVINAAVELTQARLRADAVSLDWVPDTDPVHAWGGDVRLVQVFVNLINNAADAMMDQEDRFIRIILNNSKPDLTVTVRDVGPGIKEPERIFEPFYSTKTVDSSEGMGLGLSISYGLVQSFGGNIRGENGPDGGAMFTVELEYWRAASDKAAA
ncbi:MAG: ATP-binding protein [Rhodobacteraceae bacterium]|nr:ATP-binding protein [Paracoccaceae bacterium]